MKTIEFTPISTDYSIIVYTYSVQDEESSMIDFGHILIKQWMLNMSEEEDNDLALFYSIFIIEGDNIYIGEEEILFESLEEIFERYSDLIISSTNEGGPRSTLLDDIMNGEGEE